MQRIECEHVYKGSKFKFRYRISNNEYKLEDVKLYLNDKWKSILDEFKSSILMQNAEKEVRVLLPSIFDDYTEKQHIESIRRFN